jgi:membrane protein implicated in regulation of membrane protease activity
MPWWGWIILGLLLLGSELMLVDAAFYLIFVGFAAVATGLIGLLGVPLEPWMQWLLFAVLSIVAMVFFRDRLYQKTRGGIPDYEDGMVGEFLRLSESLESGATGRMDYRGTTWTVLNDTDDAISQGTKVLVTSVDGLTLQVKKTE